MKKIAIALSVFLLMLTACGNKKPDGLSQDMYNTATHVIKIVDLYLDGEIRLEEAAKDITFIKVPDYEMGINLDCQVGTSIQAIQTDFRGASLNLKTVSITDIKVDRNTLADAINYK